MDRFAWLRAISHTPMTAESGLFSARALKARLAQDTLDPARSTTEAWGAAEWPGAGPWRALRRSLRRQTRTRLRPLAVGITSRPPRRRSAARAHRVTGTGGAPSI